ncbi:hypothetical protein AtDm6_0005 [Acetobacter tropicalis]|uniref:Uncharacterized protein n=1 Tax=Acetobacter tropicalis TaxID=104102 RepID=A0A094ZXF2_9PROT|nr:hypothetical protein AtDm6_0005 [Acetobacter tropicalis]
MSGRRKKLLLVFLVSYKMIMIRPEEWGGVTCFVFDYRLRDMKASGFR